MYINNNDIVVIIPVYNEGEFIYKNFIKIKRIIDSSNIICNFLLIDDGSVDDTWTNLQAIRNTFNNVEIIRFSRNFGKEVAICSGLENFNAQKYVIMDSDLQHPPKYIKDMLELMDKENADIVEGVKINRGKESLFYKIFAKGFYRFLKMNTGLNLNNSSDFKIINNKVVNSLRQINEKSLFFRGLVDWVGFKKVEFPFEVENREEGTSRFSIKQLYKLAITAILSHTSKPLYLTILGSIIFFIFAVVLGIQTFFNYFSGNAISGFTTIILLILFLGSLLMLSLGIIGIYISRIYDEVKGRPRYIISEKELKRNEKINELYEKLI